MSHQYIEQSEYEVVRKALLSSSIRAFHEINHLKMIRWLDVYRYFGVPVQRTQVLVALASDLDP